MIAEKIQTGMPQATTSPNSRSIPTSSMLATPTTAQSPQKGGSHSRLFPPSDLGLLDAPDRDLWQRPDQIMDAMAIADASVVADIGAGSGWFTIRLARRVGPRGVVYAEDVQKEMINAIQRRVTREGLANVRPVLGLKNDPQLPEKSLDAVLVVDAYHEVEDRVAMMRSLSRALKPRDALEALVAHFRSFTPSTDLPSAQGGTALYSELVLEKKGVCRHRAFGFMLTALGLGLVAGLSGLFEIRALLFWIALSYAALLTLEVRFAVKD